MMGFSERSFVSRNGFGLTELDGGFSFWACVADKMTLLSLDPDGKGDFMPYGKITFDSSTSASKVLEALTARPIKIGRSDLPIVVEPLRLQQGKRHWKWTRLMR